ncbi:hypothetical protein AMTR_s00161p00055850 [Amborella trichopoda]|uniref:Uncharacterized protein n=1 Tax=Amborella trichopoda TaxID=13333 RepID=W1PRL9_AMBTC|nr:hypothetical protein AMTR_s00161p00055850 [Amborella trichopoda]
MLLNKELEKRARSDGLHSIIFGPAGMPGNTSSYVPVILFDMTKLKAFYDR